MPTSTAPSSPFTLLAPLIQAGNIQEFTTALSSCDPPPSQNDLVNLFHLACENAQKEIVEILLGKGVDINAHRQEASRRAASATSPLVIALSSSKVSSEFISFLLSKQPNQKSIDDALFYAASHGKEEPVRLLLASGAKDSTPTPAIYAAALRGQLSVIEVLLANNFDVNGKNEQGNTPLHAIVSKPGEEAKQGLELLTKAGANLNSQNNQGDTPLIKAVRQNANPGSISFLISTLLASGTSLNTLNQKGAFHEAAIWGNVPHLELLLNLGNVDPNIPDLAGNTALHLIAPNKVTTAHAQYLLQNGANPNAKNNAGDTPLHVVGSVELAKVLVEAGAKVETENSADLTPVMSAIKNKDMRVAAYLATQNTDPQSGRVPSLENITTRVQLSDLDGKGNSVLHKAVEFPELVKGLLLTETTGKLQPLVNARNPQGDTPAHEACKVDFYQTLQLLLENNADIQLQNGEGKTPLDVALSMGSVFCVVCLLESKVLTVKPTPQALNEWKDEDGNSLIHKAVTHSYSHGIEVLVRNGADANIKNAIADEDAYVDGGSPLHLAAMRGEEECVRVLLALGADINNTASNEKNTPLHLACYHKCEKVVEELLKKGADANAVNENEESVMNLAEMGGSSECVALLKKALSS